MRSRSALRFVFVIGSLLALLAPVFSPATTSAADILERVRALPGVISVTEAASNLPGARFFIVDFEQPLNHQDPDGPKFRQRLTLLHRAETAPVVLELNGYAIAPRPDQYELTALLQANQIHVEHRFFATSNPSPRDWRFLTIAQSAADHHRITEAFKAIYSAKWISSGVSKGGMTSIYHRFFYPNDVDATVPYVAPSSHGTQDKRYAAFVDNLGSEECRSRLRAVQKKALKKRAKLLRFMRNGRYAILGTDRALEFAVLEFPFAFWQYNGAFLCDSIPGAEAPPREIFDFIDSIVSFSSYGDDASEFYAPYYYQSGTELGAPDFSDQGIHDLLLYGGQDVPPTYPPIGVPEVFDPAIMPRVEQWVLAEASHFIFIYGRTDPWSTNAFEVESSNDSYRFFVGGQSGNHRANITALSNSDRQFVIEKIEQWLGVTTVPIAAIQFLNDPRLRIDPPGREELFLR